MQTAEHNFNSTKNFFVLVISSTKILFEKKNSLQWILLHGYLYVNICEDPV